MPFDEGCGGAGCRDAGPAAPAGLPDRAETRRRRLRGAVAHHAGRVAEEQVEALYRRGGFEIAARRWRGRGGEIDLIARDGDRVVFIEVKSAATFAAAAEHLSARQVARLCAAAAEFVGGEPAGQDTEMRFDVALVDGTGRIDILENAIGF